MAEADASSQPQETQPSDLPTFELGHSRRAVLHRLGRLSSELGLDRERARGWTIAQTLAWAYDSEWHEPHVETVRWLVEAA